MTKFKCSKCDKVHELEKNNLEFECVATYPNREMGTEKEYQCIIELDCDNCNNHISAEFNFWEYPELTFDKSDYKVEGCILIEEPDYVTYL